MKNPKLKGYLIGAIGAATYGTNPLFALPLYGDGMNPASVLFFRYLLAIPLVYIMLRTRGRRIEFQSKKQFIPLLILGIVMAISSLSLFLAYQYMPAGIASTILFIYPIEVAVIMCFIFKEHIRLGTIACILTAMIGIWLLYKQDDGTTLNLLGTLLIVVSATTYAIYIVGINRTTLNVMPTLQTTLFIVIVCDIIYLAYLRGGIDITLPTKWYLWGNILALAALPTMLSFTCTTAAIQQIGSTPTAILGALEPATAIIIGILVFNEQITMRIAIGLTLIITSVIFVIASGSSTRVLSSWLNLLRRMFPKINN